MAVKTEEILDPKIRAIVHKVNVHLVIEQNIPQDRLYGWWAHLRNRHLRKEQNRLTIKK